jgi:tetratricopeptide (TPR) repeat protein
VKRHCRWPGTVLILSFSTWTAAAFQSPDTYAAGKSDLDHGNYAKAVEELTRADADAPGKTNALALRAKALIHLDRFADAADCLRDYLMNNPKSENARYLLGYVLFRQNLPRESLKSYTEAARLHPPSADDLKIVGLDYVLLNDYPDAVKWLEVSVARDPGNAEATYHLGRAYYVQNTFDHAIRCFETVLRLNPRFAKAEDNLGLAYEAKNQRELAEQCYRQAIEMGETAGKPEKDPYINLAELISHQGKDAEALDLLDQAERIAGKSDRTQRLRGWIYTAQGKPVEAEAELRAAIVSQPENGSLHYLLGRVLMKQGRTAEAEKEFAQTRALLGEHSSPVN